MIEYTWKIKQLDRKSSNGEVVGIHWTVFAKKDSYIANSFGAININYSEEYPFVPFEELTQETVLTWLWNNINKTEIEADLATRIAGMETPVIVSGLPWN